MLISALNDYYSVLESKGRLTKEGYENLEISYLIALSEDGKLAEIIDRREKKTENVKGKEKVKFVPVSMLFPKRPRSTAVNANFVEVRPGYIFGLEYRAASQNSPECLSAESKGDSEKKRMKLHLQHQSFSEEVQKDFSGMDAALCRALVRFVQLWKPEEQLENPALLALKSELNSARFAFCLAGHPEKMLQDEPEVREKWDSYCSEDRAADGAVICQCAVSGEMLPVAEVHDALQSGAGKGIKDAGINPSIVNFKPESFLSYGHKQGENACISQKVMKRYCKALNWILASPANHSYLDGQTIFYWSNDGNDANDTAFQMLMDSRSAANNEETENTIRAIMDAAQKGKVTELWLQNAEKEISPSADYFIVGAEPNSSRVQIKFIYRQNFGKLIQNIAKHQSDMKVSGTMRPVSIWQIKRELTSPKTNSPGINNALFDTVFKSILSGTEYPTWCLTTVIERIKKDANTEENKYIRLNDIRAGLVKACLIRHEKEDFGMALDKNNTEPAYLCGRLFAVLEKMQRDASTTKLNRTIEDAYFGSAASNPASVLPRLIVLSKHHLAKIQKTKEGTAIYDAKLMNEIMEKFQSEFPRTLNLYDQGRFILGYYQQNADLYKSHKSETAVISETDQYQ